MNRSITVTTEERKNILENFSKVKSDSYVFDLVLTENQKYLIYMDEVFTKGGISLGPIWENTHIFGEILRESVGNRLISESVSQTFENYVWSKDAVRTWINETKEQLTEGLWDKIKDIGTNIASTVFKQGILPGLRWVRKNAYTNVGIVVDILVSIIGSIPPLTPAIAMQKGVWASIVILDLYEIITGDKDPSNTERNESPYMGLLFDVLALVFVGAAAKGAKVAIQGSMVGGKIAKPAGLKIVKNVLSKIPGVKSIVRSFAEAFGKVFKGGFVGKVIGAIEKVFSGFTNFLKGLLPSQAKNAVKYGTKRSATELSLNNADKIYDAGTKLFGKRKPGDVLKYFYNINEGEIIEEQGVLRKAARSMKRTVGMGRDVGKYMPELARTKIYDKVGKEMGDVIVNMLTEKKWYQFWKKQPKNIDQFVNYIRKDSKMVTYMENLTLAKSVEITGGARKLTAREKVLVKQSVEDSINNALKNTVDDILTNGGPLGSITRKEEKILKNLQSQISSGRVKIKNFDKIVKGAMIGGYLRSKDAHKLLRKNPKAINPKTGKTEVIEKGKKIFKVAVKMAILKKLAVLGGGAYGLYWLYGQYNDLSLVNQDEDTVIVFEDENGNVVDPNEINSMASNHNLPSVLQDYLNAGSAQYIDDPKEGIYVQDDIYPDGMYLFSDGTYYDPTSEEDGTWDNDTEMNENKNFNLNTLLNEQLELDPEFDKDVDDLVDCIDGYVSAKNLVDAYRIVDKYYKLGRGEELLEAYRKGGWFRMSLKRKLGTVFMTGAQGNRAREGLYRLIEKIENGTAPSPTTSKSGNVKKTSGNSVRKPAVKLSPRNGNSSTNTPQQSKGRSAGPSRYKPCYDFPYAMGCQSDDIKLLQSSLGINSDGKFGAETLKALQDLTYNMSGKEITKEIYNEVTGGNKTTASNNADRNTPTGFYSVLKNKGLLKTDKDVSGDEVIVYDGPDLTDKDENKLNSAMMAMNYRKLTTLDRNYGSDYVYKKVS